MSNFFKLNKLILQIFFLYIVLLTGSSDSLESIIREILYQIIFQEFYPCKIIIIKNHIILKNLTILRIIISNIPGPF